LRYRIRWRYGRSTVPMRATTIRFSEDLWQLLEAEATRQGVSSAQLIRDATILRVAFLMGERGDAQATQTLEGLLSEAQRRRQQRVAPTDTPPAVSDPVRLGAVRATGLLDRPAPEGLERLTSLAARVLRAPVALVSLVDARRQFFASAVGLPEPWASSRETPLSHSFCQHVVSADEPLVVSDARDHPDLRHNPAIRDLGAVAYAGIPLRDGAGLALGTLCVIDHRPRAWSGEDLTILGDLAKSVNSEIELGRRRRPAP